MATSKLPAARPSRRFVSLLLLCAAIVVWQAGIFRSRHTLAPEPLPSMSGLNDPRSAFLYFFYYAGLFPVNTTLPKVDRPIAANDILTNRARSLTMEPVRGFIFGDWLQLLLYLPGAWWHHSPAYLDVRPFHAVAFVASLILVLLAFAAENELPFGAALVIFLGSAGSQLFHVYVEQNVWGWPITANLLALAVCLGLLIGKKRVSIADICARALVAGVFLGTLSLVRTEMLASAASVAFAFIVYARKDRRRAFAGLAAFLVVLGGVRHGWTSYFEGKIRQAQSLVAAGGGTAYHGPVNSSHVVWHALFCGLGDFGAKHGYVWNDEVAQRYAAPILRARFGIETRQERFDGFDPYHYVYHEAGHDYHLVSETLPVYGDIMREKVLGDIALDPIWYAGVLAKRVGRILTETTALSFRVGSFEASIQPPALSLLLLASALAWALAMPWFFRVLVFMGTPSLTALLIYSGHGATSSSIYHFAAASLLAAFVVRAAEIFYERRKFLAGRTPEAVG